MALQIRRGPTADRMSYTPVVGELVWDTSTNSLYIGNGTIAGGLPAGTLVTEDVQDIASTMLVSGTHNNIAFTYNDTTGRINSQIDLSVYDGTIEAPGFKGSVYASDSTLLLNALTGAVNLDGTVKGNVVPNANEAYDLGSVSNRFRDLYLSGSSIKLGSATITATGSAVNLPAGSTINGISIGAGVEAGMNYNINIVGDDSTTIINATTKSVNAASLTVGSAVNLPAGSTINGVAIGTGAGVEAGMNYNINIVGDDSTLIINARTKSISAASLSVVNPVSLPAGSTLNGTAFGFIVATEDSTSTTIANGGTLEIRGDQGCQVRSAPGGVVYVSADITELRPSIRDDATPAYITFVGNTSAPSYIGVDTALRYFANTNTLEVTSIDTATISNPVDVLTLVSGLNDGSASANLITIGNDTQDGRLNLVNNTYAATPFFNGRQSHNTADARNFQFSRSRGTTATPLVVTSGDDIVDISFSAYDGANFQVRAAIAATVDGAVSAGVVPTKIDFLTGTTTTGVAVSIGSNKQTTFNGAVKLVVYADNAARDTAITAPTAGMMVFNTTGTKFQGYTGAAWVDLN